MYNRKAFMAMLLLLGLILVPAYGFAAKKTNSATAAISAPAPAGTLSTGQAFLGGSFIGTITVTGFQVINGVLNAATTVTGHLVDPTGNPVGSAITQTVNVPLAVNGSCPILNLILGPLDLNLLGLQIHLNQVVLNIVAESGAGNLLGNLLCAVANLLNAGGPLQTLLSNLAGLLNQILAAL